LYASQYVNRVIKSRRNETDGAYSTHRRDKNVYEILIGKLEWRNHLEDLGVDEKVLLESVIEKQGGKVWTGCIWFMTGTSGGLL
jgi:hypothetical protein